MTERFDSFDEEHRALEEKKQTNFVEKIEESLKKKLLLENDFPSLEKN